MDNEEIAYRAGDILAGKYKVERVIGLGGFGAVLAATHLQLEESVAIKVLLPHAAKNPAAAERFLREARAAVRIRSEHVARVSDVGTLQDGVPYMVMEFLDGQDLSNVLKTRGAQAVPDVAEWVLQACEALAEAHSLGIVHRDLKPANLFLTRKVDGAPCVKVLDFGISKLTNEGADKGMTKTSDVMGSPFYMSPEQMRSTRSVDARSDIWALGAILYEMLAGAPPFDAETMTALVVSIMQEPPRDLGMFRRDIPPGVRDIIMCCLQKDPNQRFADVASLAQALAPFAPQRATANIQRVMAISGRNSNPLVGAAAPTSAPTAPSAPGTHEGTMASMPASVAFAGQGYDQSAQYQRGSGDFGGYPAQQYGQGGFAQSGGPAGGYPPGIPGGAAHMVASGASPAQSWGGTYMGKKQGGSKAALIVGLCAVFIVLGGGAFGIYYVLNQKPTKTARNNDDDKSDRAAGRDNDKAPPAPTVTANVVPTAPTATATATTPASTATAPPTATATESTNVATAPPSSEPVATTNPKDKDPKKSKPGKPPPPPPPPPPPIIVIAPPPPPPPPPKPTNKPPNDPLFGRPD